MLIGDKYILETEVIDTGVGLPDCKKGHLFLPFKELQNRVNSTQVHVDLNTGMGLTCSKMIANFLDGDVTVKLNQEGLTVFAFKIPIEVDEEISDYDMLPNSKNQSIEINVGQQEVAIDDAYMNGKVVKYLRSQGLEKLTKTEFINKVDLRQAAVQSEMFINRAKKSFSMIKKSTVKMNNSSKNEAEVTSSYQGLSQSDSLQLSKLSKINDHNSDSSPLLAPSNSQIQIRQKSLSKETKEQVFSTDLGDERIDKL